ncbi:MAG TPA: DUF222 domain-containing protein, partial [Actinotalea sp.]|nr:DUF222 domain-containing protein [Actinotalea sp.]
LVRLAPTSDARRAALAGTGPAAGTVADENALVQVAARMPVDEFRREVGRWAASVDQAAHERSHERTLAAEHLTLTRREDGLSLQGFLTHEHGVALVTALRAVAGVPAADDARSRDQRQAAALTGLARLVLDGGLAGGGAQVRPHLSVHVSWETAQRLTHEHAEAAGSVEPATFDDGTPLPPSVLARLVCDSEISRMVFGPAGQVLDVGRAQRTYTGQLRRAVVARDRTCRYPGCDAPPTLGEVHHITHWGRGGATSVSNGILLCWFHHDLVHRRGLRITRGAPGATGSGIPVGPGVAGGPRAAAAWRFTRPDGTVLARPSPPAHPPDRPEPPEPRYPPAPPAPPDPPGPPEPRRGPRSGASTTDLAQPEFLLSG